MQKVMFASGHWLRAEGSDAMIDEQDGAVFLAFPVRNVGSGIAVLQGWYPWPELTTSEVDHGQPELVRRQIRDIYVASGDVGMWQASLRDPEATPTGDDCWLSYVGLHWNLDLDGDAWGRR